LANQLVPIEQIKIIVGELTRTALFRTLEEKQAVSPSTRYSEAFFQAEELANLAGNIFRPRRQGRL
jgi:hypothetical protein